LLPGLRAILHGRRIIYFRLVGDECRIVRIFHSRQNVGKDDFLAEEE